MTKKWVTLNKVFGGKIVSSKYGADKSGYPPAKK